MKKLKAYFLSISKKQKAFFSIFSEAISEGIKDGLKEWD